MSRATTRAGGRAAGRSAGRAGGGRWLTVAVATAARRALADPGALAFTAVLYVVITTVLGGVWRVAADGGQVAGYDGDALTWYILASEAVTVSLGMRLIERMADSITDGDVAVEMLRPAPVLGIRLATEVGRALPPLVTCTVTGLVAGVVITGGPPDGAALALAAPALVLAITANLAGQHACSALAFWTREARTSWFLYQKLVFILGGMLLPIEVLPDGLQPVARVLPFAAMAYVPGRLASGHVEPHLLAVQAAWLVALVALAAWAFAAGQRRLQVVGG